MAIGSKIIGRVVIAGQYGIIERERLALINQRVNGVQAALTATLTQSVQQLQRSATVRMQQRVLEPGQQPSGVRPPAAYVIINGDDVTGITALDTVSVTFNEGQSATASVFLYYETGATVDIPALHGKAITITTHSDPNDVESDIVPLFTGYVETARHDRARMGVAIQASDLRDERISRENRQALMDLTGAMYSDVTQREEPSDREYVAEMMKTVSGALGYGRAGDLRYHSWGVAVKPVALTLLDEDVSYDDLTTEFQTRSSIVNSVSVDLDYRYSLLRRVSTTVDAYKPRNFKTGEWASGAVFNYEVIDWKAFRRDYLISQMDTYAPFETVSYAIYPLEKALPVAGSSGVFIDALWSSKDLWGQGFKAVMERRVAQPITEKYSFKVTAPQSVDAYGETVDGSALRFAIDTEYDRGEWETDFKVTPKLPNSRLASSVAGVSEPTAAQLAAAIAEEKALADNRRDDLAVALECAYRIARKEIISSHRKNFVSCVLHRIQPLDIGDIVQHDNRIVSTVGQCAGLEYTIADGLRQTQIRIAVSYMDTELSVTDSWSVPDAPTKPTADVSIDTEVEYSTEEGAFEIEIAETPEEYTDNIDQEVSTEYTVELEINPITLINGY